VSAAFQNVNPLKMVESRPAVSNCVIIWATFASAVGETKLALSAMFAVLALPKDIQRWSKASKTRTAAVHTVEGPSVFNCLLAAAR
jgi:hypothetical protein